MKLNLSVTTMLVILALAVLAAVYRVSTAPERIRKRLDAARAACLSAGGQWVKLEREELCQPAAGPKP